MAAILSLPVSRFCYAYLLAMMVICGCANPTPSQTEPDRDVPIYSIIKKSESCYDIRGYVLGNISPGAEIFLYPIRILNYSPVMNTVRFADPIRMGTVNATAGYNFSCLPVGNYTTVIPTGSFRNRSVGAPLPVEIEPDTGDLSIAFQGGDIHYMVGAFSITAAQD